MSRPIDYPSLYQELYYKPNQAPQSYSSEFPQDFPYDPGATSSLYELGYIPSQSSFILLMILVLLFFSLLLFFFLRSKARYFFSFAMIFAICLSFLGPLRLSGGIRFQTTLGVAKFIALGSFLIGFLYDVFRRNMSIVHHRSFVPIAFYLVLSFFSVFWVTNLNFFLSDMNLIITGLLFYGAAFYHLGQENHVRHLAISLSYLILFPAIFVLGIFLFPSYGSIIMSWIFPRYENIVFHFDLSRDRILSIIDLEFFIPFVCYLYLASKKKHKASVIFLLSFFAVLLTNYRYRFLSFVVGVLAYVVLAGRQHFKQLLLSTGVIASLVFISYIVISTTLGRTTIIDRFLMKSYENDVDSLRRRVVMARQALDVFRQFPLLGVGVGNYKDNVQVYIENYGGRTYEPTYKILQNVYAYPHNWFLLLLAENGIVGLCIILWMLYEFLRTDIFLYRSLREEKWIRFLAFSVTSWLYVFANMFTPLHNSLPMVIIFWSFRGILARMEWNMRFSYE